MRLYRDAYDASLQNELYRDAQPGGVGPARNFLAALRLDTLLAEKVVILDSQFLFSPYFFELAAPRDRCGAPDLHHLPPGLEIAARADNLGDALVQMLSPPGSDTLAAYMPQMLSAAQRIQVGRELRKIRASTIRRWSDIPDVYRAADVEYELVDQMEEAWASVADTHLLRLAPWPVFNWTKNFGAQLKNEESDVWCALGQPDSMRELEASLGSRGEFYLRIAELEDKGRIDDADAATLKSWYSAAYNRTIAQQHGCDLEETSFPRSRAISGLHRVFDGVWQGSGGKQANVPRIDIQPEFMAALGDTDPSLVESIHKEYPEHLRRWHNEGRTESLRILVEHLVDKVENRVGFKASGPLPEWVLPQLRVVVRNRLPTIGAAIGWAIDLAFFGGKSTLLPILLGAESGTLVERTGGKALDRIGDKKVAVARRIVKLGQKYRQSS